MSKNHVKPTNAELEANAKAALDAVEKLEDTPQPEPAPESDPTPEPVPQPDPTPEAERQPEPEPEPAKDDFKKKFSESSREAQKLNAKNKVLSKGIAAASEVEEATEEELQAQYSEWEVMTDTEKRLARENLISSKRFKIMHEANQVALKIEKWGEDVDSYTEDPKTLVDHPELEGKLEDFKTFANFQGNHGTDLGTLTKAFLYEQSTKPKPVNKGAMFETGSGGPNERVKPKSDKITPAEADTLRKTDYKKFLEYTKEGKIDFSTI